MYSTSLELTRISCVTETLYLLNNIAHFPLPAAPGNHHSTLCFCEFDYFRYLMYLDLCFCDWLISPSIMSSKFIHIIACDRISFFLRLNSIPLYIYAASSFSTHPLIDTSVVSISWLLWIMLQWTWAADTASRSWFQFLWINTLK